MNREPGIMPDRGSPPLPSAQRDRWQPIRGGLLNLFRFDYEEFRYENGHLLLRGNNGTGKSRVLALQLPFLLDGEVASHRMEPDGDPAKRIEWNLLLNKHKDRLGYTWIEFGRRDGDGRAAYLTLGCGLNAVAGKGLVGKWFFVTRKRIGQELYLQADAGHPLTRERLAEALGDEGEVFTTAKAYRQAVDHNLFKLGDHRYAALINLLIQLRQPQLSRQLDERRLSAALSEALPPVSTAILADVAESFRSLESDRQALDGFKAASGGAEAFLGEYTRYARIAARRRAERVRTTQSAYEQTMRQLRIEEVNRRAAAERLGQLKQRLEDLGVAEHAAGAAVEALRADPTMRSADDLDAAETRADERAAEERRCADELDQSATTTSRRQQQQADDEKRATEAWSRVESGYENARQRAAEAGLENEHRTAFETLELRDLTDSSNVNAARGLLEDAVKKRLEGSRHVQALNRRLRQSENELTKAKEAQAEITTQLDATVEQQRIARDALMKSADTLIAAYRDWCEGVSELRPDEPADIAEAVHEWCRMAEGKSPVELAKNDALSEAARRIEQLRVEVEQRRLNVRERLTELNEQAALLDSGYHEPPEPPHTRGPEARAGRAGAPLWALCDFATGVSEVDRAGVEAALVSSGLLDAWVTPEGQLLGPDVHDTILAVGTSPPAPDDQHLGQVLTPAPQAEIPGAEEVSEQTIANVLRHVGFGRNVGHVWIASSGAWQVGPLHGAWTKPAARFIGRDAREAHRQRCLAEVHGQIKVAGCELEEAETQMRDVLQRRQTVEDEAARAPDEASVHRSLADVDAASRSVDLLRGRVADADARVSRRRREWETEKKGRDDAARDLRVTDWIDDLQSLDDALGAFAKALAALWPTVEAHIAARDQAVAAAARAADAMAEEERRKQILLDARRKAEATAAKRDALRESVGAAVQEIRAKLEAARGRAEHIRQEQEQSRKEERQADIALNVADDRITGHEEALNAHTSHREQAIAAFGRFAASQLLATALPTVDVADPENWSVTAAVEMARRVDIDLTEFDYDDGAWNRSQKGIHRHIQELNDALLPHGYAPSSTIEDDLFVVTVPFQGRICTMSEVRAALTDEITARQTLLDAREREVLENHLIGEVASHLHDRLHAGEEWVREMNAELAERPMSTGLTLRFKWEVADDGPVGLAEARKRLLSVGGMLSPDQREALGVFLQQQIQAVRAANDTGTWQEHLATALDYRGWHRFYVERKQEDQWKRLTRRTHGTASGGEKAIALTVPQFAAAAAHYRSADKTAPRLILLDEAFVGVDTDMRSKCMGLLETFDLDFVMTSEREWGCYSTLGALAIYQLATRPGIDAVGLTRWIWNGQERVRDNTRLPGASQAAEHAATETLFGAESVAVRENGRREESSRAT